MNKIKSKLNLVKFCAIAFVLLMSVFIVSFISADFNAKEADAKLEVMKPETQKIIKDNQTDPFESLMDCYNAYCHAYTNGYGFQMITELMGADCMAGGSVNESLRTRDIDEFKTFDGEDNSNLFDTEWCNYYNAIAYCNCFIQNIEPMNNGGTGKWDNDLPPEVKDQYMGEARGLRALCYYNLSLLFGRVPIVTEPGALPEVRATEQEVFDQMLADTKFAEAYCLNKSQGLASNRFTKEAALMLLAKAYMQNKNYKEASEVLKKIIAMNTCELDKDYNNLWASVSYDYEKNQLETTYDGNNIDELLKSENYTGGNSNEAIFCIKYNSDTFSENVSNMDCVAARNLPIPASYNGEGQGKLSVSNALVKLFFQEKTKDGYLDPRLFASITDYENELKAGFFDADDLNDMIETTEEYSGFGVRKYSPLTFKNGQNTHFNQDIILYRFADTLLLEAECLNEVGDFTQALIYINMVRNRVNLKELDPLDFRDKYKLGEQIKIERAKELAFEGILFWDHIRWNDLPEWYKKYATQDVLTGGDNVPYQVNGELALSRPYCQIPQNQIAIFGYEQNPGW